MAVQAYDTQQGATITFATDSLTLRLTDIGPLHKVLAMIRTTYLATTTAHTYIPGELADYPPIPVTYQNGPGIANPTNVSQTVTFTGPTASGATVPESAAGTAFVVEQDVLPGFSSASENLQTKTIMIKFDGLTPPVRTVSS